MTDLGPAPPVPDTEQLIQLLKAPLLDSIQRDVSDDSDADKIAQYANARRNYLVYRGYQFLGRSSTGGVADYQSIGGFAGGNNGAVTGQDGGAYSYTNNIFRGKGRKFIAVLGQRAPNVTAVADDPDSDKGDKAARNGNKLNAILDSWWDVDERQMEATETIFTTGPAFIYTPWNANGDLYGFREEPVYAPGEAQVGEDSHQCIQCGGNQPPGPDGNCPQCGTEMGPESQMPADQLAVPSAQGTKKYPNGQVECHVYSVLYVTTPFYVKRLKLCPWLKLELEENKGVLLKAFPKLRATLGASDGDKGSDSSASGVGRAARDTVMSPTASPKTNSNSRWSFVRIWLQTTQYELFKSEHIRQVLAENFPEGLKISLVNGDVVDLEDEKLDHVWSVIKPEAGEGINIDPVGQDLISAQFMANQSLNIGMETLERGISVILADPRVWNFEQIRKRQSKPAEFIPAKHAVGESLADSFFPTPPARMSDQQEPFIAAQVQQATENVGITPQIFGGGAAATAREAEINKNAAMMQLGITWTFIRKGWEQAKFNGARQLAKHGPSVIAEGKLVVEMAELLEANWRYVADEAVPTSWGQQRDLLLFMLEKPPQVLESWGYGHPDNIAKAQSLLGMQGWYTPNVDDIEKFKDVIGELLQAAPIQQQAAPPAPGAAPAAPDYQPSIPADEYEDNHALASTFVQAWAQSETGRNARKDNQNGYANVICWGKAHAKLAQPPPPAPPPQPPPKLSLSASLDKMDPAQATALIGDFNLKVPPATTMPVGMQGGPMPPAGPPAQGGAPQSPGAPPATVQ